MNIWTVAQLDISRVIGGCFVTEGVDSAEFGVMYPAGSDIVGEP